MYMVAPLPAANAITQFPGRIEAVKLYGASNCRAGVLRAFSGIPRWYWTGGRSHRQIGTVMQQITPMGGEGYWTLVISKVLRIN